MPNVIRFRRQRGAVIVTVCLALLFLLGFIGIAVDLGRLFIVRSELQTAMDSCALAAAQELDGMGDSIVRATSAGLTTGNLNAVNLQSPNWSGQGQITSADLIFHAADYSITTDPVQARYAECVHTQPNIATWLLPSMNAFAAGSASMPNGVLARAVATRGSAQSTCPLPLALRPKTGSAGPDYGFQIGEWITVVWDQSAFTGGQIGWMSLIPGQSGESAIENQLNGFCGTKLTDTLTPSDSGAKQALAEAWNYRFGLYKSTTLPDFSVDPYKRPDLTGYAYGANWAAANPPAVPNVYNAYDDFVGKRAAHVACAGSVAACSSAGPWTLNGYKSIAASGDGPRSHGAYGTNRRLVVTPVVSDSNKVINFACLLILEPHYAGGSAQPIHLEYRGNAGALTSPCTIHGIPGGAAGPLVPVLVR
jgi:hypothetical protein